MKKISYLLAVLVLCAISASATGISKNKAQTVATSFFQKGLMKANVGEVKLVKEYASSKDAPAAVFAFSRGENVVFVSAEDKMPAILGYTENADMNDMPPALEAMLQYYAQLTDAVRAGKIDAPKLYASAEKVDTLLHTSWYQTSPFWDMCPKYKEEQLPNGCVSTAMAQIMKYYKWPNKPTGKTPEYTTFQVHYGMKIPSVDLESHTYNWDNMLDVYKEGSYTEEQGQEIAQLCYDVAVASKMDFYTKEAGGSGTLLGLAAYAMRKYFGYNKDVKMDFANFHSEEEWVAMLKNELSQGRPLPYCGTGSGGGHCFVIDGYNTEGLFHVNWGWGGHYNGYFLITSLDREKPGMEGAGSEGGFFDNQQTLFDFFPDREGTTTTTGEHYVFQYERCARGDEKNAHLQQFWNRSIDPFKGSLIMQLIDENGKLVAEQIVKKDYYLNTDSTDTDLYVSLEGFDFSTFADGIYHTEVIAVSDPTGNKFPVHHLQKDYRIRVKNGVLRGIFYDTEVEGKFLTCEVSMKDEMHIFIKTKVQVTNVDDIIWPGKKSINVRGQYYELDDEGSYGNKDYRIQKELQPGETYTFDVELTIPYYTPLDEKGNDKTMLILGIILEHGKDIDEFIHGIELPLKDFLTDIKDVKINKKGNSSAYSLDGKRVNASSAKGVIIKDGKKTLSPLSH